MKKFTAIVTTLLILCLFVGVATAETEERVTNGDFSNGLSNWYTGDSTSESSVVADSGGARLQAQTTTTYGNVGKASISQYVDLTNVNQITWKTKPIATVSDSSYVMFIYRGSTRVASYTWSELGTAGQYNSHSYTIGSPLEGEYYITFEAQAQTLQTGTIATTVLYLDDISAIATVTPASASGSFYVGLLPDNTPVFANGEQTTFKYSFSQGTDTGSYAVLNWGDSSTSNLSVGTDLTVTHTYNAEGIFSPNIKIYNAQRTLISTVTIPTVYIISLDFIADKTSAEPGTVIYFTATATIPSSTQVSSYAWNFGDGNTATGISTSHTYSSAGVYDVNLTITLSAGAGYTYTVLKADYITTSAQTVSFSSTSVLSGTQITASWNLRDADFPYKLYVYPSTNAGVITDYTAKYSADITTATGTTSQFSIGDVGYYTVLVQKGTNVIAQSTTALEIYKQVTLTVQVYNDNVAFTTAQSTVSLYKTDGTLVETKQTTLSGDVYTNEVQFQNVKTGNYYVTIHASGQTDKSSPTITISDNYILRLDFTLGVSDSSLVGVGSQYATTFVTFRTQDSGTGRYIPNVKIVATAVQPTNAWEYFANLFGASLGTVIQSMTLEGTSDMDGRITFAMYQNVRYNLNITYNDGIRSYHDERSFQQSTMSGEYLIDIPLTDNSGERYTEDFITEVSTEGEQIIANFTDNSGTVTSCQIIVYKKEGDERKDTNTSVVITNPIQGQLYPNTFTPIEPSGQSYIVSYVITSSTLGTKTQEYGVTFAGVNVKLGNIPNEWYIWISFAIILMTGAVATFINSRHFAIVVCIVATLLFFAGWLNQLGAFAPIALILCYVLTIVYYIANHNGSGT